MSELEERGFLMPRPETAIPTEQQAALRVDQTDMKMARLTMMLAALERGVETRVVRTEDERARLQAADRSGHQWRIGEEYVAVADVMATRKTGRLN